MINKHQRLSQSSLNVILFLSKYNQLVRIISMSMLITMVFSYQNCGTSNIPIGCLTCVDGSGDSLVFNQTQQKYTCSDILNCLVIDDGFCLICIANYQYNEGSNVCQQAKGCTKFNQTCIECDQINYFLDNETCISKGILFCQRYNGSNSCAECKYQYMDPNLNCSLKTNLCSLFDQTVWKCMKCPVGTIIHSSGAVCATPTYKCLLYQQATGICSECLSDYFFNSVSTQCLGLASAGLLLQVPKNPIQLRLLQTTNLYQYICIRRDRNYNQATLECDLPVNDSTHCIILSLDGLTCDQCRPSYYSTTTNTICLQCEIAIQYCVLCSSKQNCETCKKGYYLLPTGFQGLNSQCLTCKSYGCQQCTATYNQNQFVLQIQCVSCPLGSTLFRGACYPCTQKNSSFSVQDSECQICSMAITNCQYCSISYITTSLSYACLWCVDGYFYNPTTSSCVQINNSTVIQLVTAYQILSKAAPGTAQSSENNQFQMMGKCDETNGYICQCSQTGLSSVCKAFLYKINVSPLTTNTLSEFSLWAKQMRIAAEFQTFKYSQIAMTGQVFMSQTNYWNLLSAYTYLLIRKSNQSSTILRNIYSHISNSMQKVYSQQKVTLLTGNGFYYKYIPVGITSGDDDYVYTSINRNSYWVLIYIWYDRIPSTTQLTGHIYVYTDFTGNFTINVRKNGYLSNTNNFTLSKNGVSNNANVILSDGYLQLSQSFKTTASALNGYQVFSVGQSTDDPYAYERIQYIFYSQSFLYILFFLLLYLIFLPICSMVDCCTDVHVTQRKKITSQDLDEHSNNKNQQEQSSQEKVVKINYRDFFPIYNVSNTPRPYRLMKLSLLIVDLQHGVTYLTLIYFNLNVNLGVAAVALAIPAYLCTVVAGYICGFIFRVLPSKTKYLINLISLGYWILWVALMRMFTSNQYKLYLLVFVIIFFIIDLVIDALETLLVYFSIRQGDSQVQLFNCLAKWLSYRGFYEFDKLAKELANEYE